MVVSGSLWLLKDGSEEFGRESQTLQRLAVELLLKASVPILRA